MPIYMDRHDVSSEVTAEIVADLHQKDLKIQHKFNCNGLTYWFDDKRKTAFCLVEAPNKEAIEAMHLHAHGAVAYRIIEVDGNVVESFLGRIEDPEKSKKAELNIINDPAFRTIMIAKIKPLSFSKNKPPKLDTFLNNLNKTIGSNLKTYEARLVKQKYDHILISFISVTQAVMCALQIKAEIQTAIQKYSFNFNIGISAGVPVGKKGEIFEDTIELAERMCYVAKDQILVSSEVKDLYESENLNITIDPHFVISLNSNDEKFLNQLMDYMEIHWRNTTLNVEGLSKFMACSKSQLYRKMIALTRFSPNSFIKMYRLDRALELLDKKNNNISEIAFKTGFNSPAYFSKCFQKAYGTLPSAYTKPPFLFTNYN